MHDALLMKVQRTARPWRRGGASLGLLVAVAARTRGAVNQESVGGARESGRVRSAAVDDRSRTDGAHLIPCPWRIRRTVAGFCASGAVRKRWNAQSAGWTRAH